MAHVLVATALVVSPLACAPWRIGLSGEPRQTLINRLPSRGESVALIMGPGYREFISEDRGHALADPQNYEIGEGLQALTKACSK